MQVTFKLKLCGKIDEEKKTISFTADTTKKQIFILPLEASEDCLLDKLVKFCLDNDIPVYQPQIDDCYLPEMASMSYFNVAGRTRDFIVAHAGEPFLVVFPETFMHITKQETLLKNSGTGWYYTYSPDIIGDQEQFVVDGVIE